MNSLFRYLVVRNHAKRRMEYIRDNFSAKNKQKKTRLSYFLTF